jgi:glucose/arabinose dehydrogenase
VAALTLAACGSQSGNRVHVADTGTHGVRTSAGGSSPAGVAETVVPLTVPAANTAFSVRVALTLPRGWTAEVWALVPGARLETWTPQGGLLVSVPSSGSIVELVRGARPGAPPAKHTLVSGLVAPQGMAFDRIGGHEVLYVAEADALDRYVWQGGSLGQRTVLARGLPDAGPAGADVHTLKNVVVGANHTIYVDIGSASNASPPAPSGAIPRASVVAFQPNGSRRVFATGIRNGDGLSFAPDGTLWTAVNERDQIAYPFHRAYGGLTDAFGHVIPGYVNDHPPDELARLTAGRNLGWPFCDPDPDLQAGLATTGFDYQNMPFDADAQTNAGGKRLDCARLTRIQRGIPAHSAPLGFHFLRGSSLPAPWNAGAVVAVHGSWDREPPRPPGILWLPWESATHSLGPAVTIVSGFQEPNGARWGRTVDAVAGPDGALYVSDDVAGAIYRIVPTKGL